MGFKNIDGTDIKKVWAEEGIQSYLGMTMAGFPNAFMIYSPHGMFPRPREAPLRALTLSLLCSLCLLELGSRKAQLPSTPGFLSPLTPLKSNSPSRSLSLALAYNLLLY
jgi:hypothetical protein